MTPSLEVLLIAGIVAFYVHDSALLLYHDELVFERAGGQWRASPGGAQWSGRFLYVPNPLAPWRGLLRAAWTEQAAPQEANAGEPVEGVMAALRPLQFGVALLGALLVAGVPVLMWRYPHPLALLGLVIAIYAVSLALAAIAWLRRACFGLDGRSAAWLAVECVACPPHAINLVRKLSLRQPVPGGALAFAAAHLTPAAKGELDAALSERRPLADSAP